MYKALKMMLESYNDWGNRHRRWNNESLETLKISLNVTQLHIKGNITVLRSGKTQVTAY